MFHFAFKALFNEFWQLRMRKKDCYAYQNSSYLWCINTQETFLSLETSSEINFEFIKFVKKNVKCPVAARFVIM